MAEKSRFQVFAGTKSLTLDRQSCDVMQSTETTFAGSYICENWLLSYPIDQPPSIFLSVILLDVNKLRSWQCPWTSSKKRKKAYEKKIHSMRTDGTSESWLKVEATSMGSSLQKIDGELRKAL